MKKTYTLDEVYKIFGKSKKLKVLGFTEGYSTNLENVFFYVDDELSTKEFYQLNSQEKSAYIRKLFNLPEEEFPVGESGKDAAPRDHRWKYQSVKWRNYIPIQLTA